MTLHTRPFYWLSDALQPAAEQAAAVGLTLSHCNTGGRHVDNGTRIFRATDGVLCVNHWRGDHLAHYRKLEEVLAFLKGYKAAQSEGNET